MGNARALCEIPEMRAQRLLILRCDVDDRGDGGHEVLPDVGAFGAADAVLTGPARRAKSENTQRPKPNLTSCQNLYKHCRSYLLGPNTRSNSLHNDRRITTTDSLPLLSSSPQAATVPTSPLQLHLLCRVLLGVCTVTMCADVCVHKLDQWRSSDSSTDISITLLDFKEGHTTLLAHALHWAPSASLRDLECRLPTSFRSHLVESTAGGGG